MRSDDKYYLIGLGILTFFELILSLPLMTDSFLDEGLIWVCLAVGAGHFFLLMYAGTGMVDIANNKIHLLGIAAVFFSIIPAIGFVLHIPVAYLGVKTCFRLGKPVVVTEKRVKALRFWDRLKGNKKSEDVKER